MGEVKALYLPMTNVHDSDIEIGLLPVPLVLFPGGKLKMTVALAQDQDLLGRSLKDAVGVGLVLSEQQIWVNDGSTEDAASTEETRAQSHPEIASVGTYCEILDFDQNAKAKIKKLGIKDRIVLLQINSKYEAKATLLHLT